MTIDFKLIDNVVVDGIDYNDYPDFCDAYIAEADYDGKPMSDEMIEVLNYDHTDFILEQVYSNLF
jgi:hypothetical protein